MVGTEGVLRLYDEFNFPRGDKFIRRHVGSCEGERLRDIALPPRRTKSGRPFRGAERLAN